MSQQTLASTRSRLLTRVLSRSHSGTVRGGGRRGRSRESEIYDNAIYKKSKNDTNDVGNKNHHYDGVVMME